MESAAPAVEENTASVEKTAPKPKKEKAAKKEAEPAAAEEAEAKPVSKKTTKSAGKDDLKIIEGIGPKIATLLSEAGITTFSELASTGPEKISEILSDAGSRYKMHDPTTWPQQAALAAEGKWEELKVLQDSLKGGKAE
jgi:predicted flap endonuclease-1-like 5' DNA nuclease